MNYSSKLLLLMQPTILQGVATPPILLPGLFSPASKPSISDDLIAANMAMAYPEFSSHDWGPFGQYEYLGPGTDYAGKHEAGVKPKNDLDRIAKSHDAGYEESKDLMTAGKLLIRGTHDLGAGAAMIVAGLNPWSDAPLLLSLGSGAALIGQGILRFHPVTMFPMAVADHLLYTDWTEEQDIPGIHSPLIA